MRQLRDRSTQPSNRPVIRIYPELSRLTCLGYRLPGPSVPVSALTTIDRLLATFVGKSRIVVGGPRPLLRIAGLAILIALLTRFPHYGMLPQLSNDVQNQAISWQVRHPLTPIPANWKNIDAHGGAASHVDKMELRLTVPLLGRLSGTGLWTVVVWSPIAAALLFYLFAVCARDAIGSTTDTAFFVIGLGATFFGAWGFNDFIFGDAVGLALTLLSACCLRHPWLSALCFLGAAFCDERSVTAAPLLLLYFIVRCSKAEEKKQRDRLLFAITAAIGVWVALRCSLSAMFHLSTGASLLTWNTFLANMTSRQTLFSLIGLFRASWILPVLALRHLILQKEWTLLTSFVSAFVIAILPAFLVVDINRSICFIFMIFFISLRLLGHNWDDRRSKYLAAIMLANILITPPSKTIFRLLA